MKYNFVVNNKEVSLSEMHVVAVLSMRTCNNPVASIKLLRTHFNLGLKDTKDLSEFIGNTFYFELGGVLKTKKDDQITRYLVMY